MNAKSTPPPAGPISLVFQWGEHGLDLLRSPVRMENYRIPPVLQRSLGASPPLKVPDAFRPSSGQTIPFGVVANLLIRTEWGRLNLNFEPAGDRRLRFYMSFSDLRLPDSLEQVAVDLFRAGRPLSRDFFDRRGTYQGAPLPPGEFRGVYRRGLLIAYEGLPIWQRLLQKLMRGKTTGTREMR